MYSTCPELVAQCAFSNCNQARLFSTAFCHRGTRFVGDWLISAYGKSFLCMELPSWNHHLHDSISDRSSS